MATEFINCDLNTLPFDVIVKSLLTTDTNGNVAIRVVNNTDAGTDVLDCDTKSLTLEQAIRRALIVDDNGKIALNLAVTTVTP